MSSTPPSLTTPLPPPSATAVLHALWQDLDLPSADLTRVRLTGANPGFSSSFALGEAAQAAVAASTLMSSSLGQWRQPQVQPLVAHVDMAHALAETTGYFTLASQRPAQWAPTSGLYPCGEAIGEPGWVRIHANFAHHRDGALHLLGLPTGDATTREQVQAALRHVSAQAFEAQAAERGLVVAAARTRAAWLAHPQQAAVAAQPLVALTPLDDGQPAAPLRWRPLADAAPPLQGLRVLDLTRILAGPVAARTLAAHGASVLMVNSPHLPNIEAIADVSRGKRSAWLDLRATADRERLHQLVGDAQVFLQGYHPGGLAALGFGPEALARARPGLVYASLSAYGRQGPWADRRGFDSLVQTVCGLNLAEAQALGTLEPQALPVQILDYCAGFLLAFGIQAALWRQQTQGGSWHVAVNLARVAEWLWSLGQRQPPSTATQPAAAGVPDAVAPFLETLDSGFGPLCAVRHSGQLLNRPVHWPHPAAPPGSAPAAWWS
ncbi:hypothetical protein CCO03_15185 [Comamonas serinivorans]|uniref:Carnitine dehydratase n=1 Tax=Comamonas serinivorans TaxID=1082851 RepID=A0A1Y0ET94_9BURK|nr:CoA transferase [Comamonas serinivorans]ARU06894.1 hypothetical protein CCO03_15185 [Comamonas serinivorans]